MSGPAALFAPEATHLGAGSVVVGDLSSRWTFAALNRASRLLMANPAAVLVALGTARYWRAVDGLRLDVGPFVTALEYATGRRAVVLGKPSRQFFETAVKALDCVAVQTVMVGDDIVVDVCGARDAGMRGLLVRTGKFREQDPAGDIRAAGVLNSLADLPVWWCEHGGC